MPLAPFLQIHLPTHIAYVPAESEPPSIQRYLYLYPVVLPVAYGTTSRLNLARRQTAAASRFKTEFAEADFAARKSQAAVTTFVLFTKFGTFWLQHVTIPLLGCHSASI